MMNFFSQKFLHFFKILTLADKILVAGIACMSIVSLLSLQWLAKPGAYAIIDEGGHDHYRFNLNENKLIICHGPIGETVIQIQDGKARVLRSDCPNQICVNSGTIDRAGQIIVCVPNKVLLKIQGDKKMQSLDVITE